MFKTFEEKDCREKKNHLKEYKLKINKGLELVKVTEL